MQNELKMTREISQKCASYLHNVQKKFQTNGSKVNEVIITKYVKEMGKIYYLAKNGKVVNQTQFENLMKTQALNPSNVYVVNPVDTLDMVVYYLSPNKKGVKYVTKDLADTLYSFGINNKPQHMANNSIVAMLKTKELFSLVDIQELLDDEKTIFNKGLHLELYTNPFGISGHDEDSYERAQGESKFITLSKDQTYGEILKSIEKSTGCTLKDDEIGINIIAKDDTVLYSLCKPYYFQ